MDPSAYGPGDWSEWEIKAAKALWTDHNPHRPIEKLHPAAADAWMVYLYDARIVIRTKL